MKKLERRIVSVLFADLVGYTAMSERFHPEDVALIQDHYFQRVKETVDKQGGLIEKFIGDAAVAVFGLPLAREDDAERAVRAGLEIVRSVGQIAAELGIPSDILDVRVGVNTGEVIFSQMSEDLDDWRVTGDVVNVAARLQSAARPGSVLLGPETALSVEAGIDLQSAGAFELKGKSEPIQAWWAIAPRIAPSRRHVLGLCRAPTVGRDDELNALQEALDRIPGRAEFWVIVAPPGVGKTHLVEAFSEKQELLGETNFRIARIGSGSAMAYEPIRDLLVLGIEDACISLEFQSEAELLLKTRLAQTGRTGLHAELVIEHTAALVWHDDFPLSQDDREALFRSWVTALEALSESRPSVWVLDDLHWAKPDMLSFLEYSATFPTYAGRLILATARPAFIDTVPHWYAPDSEIKILHLENLAAREAERLIQALLGAGVLPGNLESQIIQSSDGNPLFVEELIRAWVARGMLVLNEDGKWEYKGADQEVKLPTTVQAIYAAQLDNLPLEGRRAACLGSICGRQFPIAALENMGLEAPETIIPQLVTRQIIAGPHPDPVLGECFSYRHALLKDVAYASMSRSDRARLHVRFAVWLEGQPSSLELASEQVGNHYFDALENASPLTDHIGEGLDRAMVASRAATWLEQAAMQALKSAPQSATTLLERCLGLTPEESLADQMRLSLQLGEAFRRSGNLESAMTTFESSAMKGIVARNPETLVSSALGYEDALFSSRLPRRAWGDKSTSLLTAALEALGAGESGPHAKTLAALGRSLTYRTTPNQGAARSREAAEMARRTGDPAALAYALLALRSSQAEPKKLQQRLEEVIELVRAAREGGDREMELEGQRLRLLDLLELGEVDEANRIRQQAVSLIEALRRPMYFWYPPMWQSMWALFKGSFAEAEEKIENFRLEGKRWNYRDVDQVYGVQYFHLQHDLGCPELAQQTLEQISEAFGLPEWSPILGQIYSKLGLIEKARAQFGVYAPSFARVPSDLRWAYDMALLSEQCAFLEDKKAASTIYTLLSHWANHNIVLGSGAHCLGSASYYLGLAARTMQDLPSAIEHFRSAVEMNKKMGALPAELRSRLELARTLIILGQNADDSLHIIIDQARNIGMAGVVREGHELLSPR